MKRTTSAIEVPIAAAALLGLVLFAMPLTARAQDATAQPAAPDQAAQPAPPPPPPPDQTAQPSTPPASTDQGQPTYQGGEPQGGSNAPPPPPPPEQHHHRLAIGINAGVFVPTSNKVRNRFGNNWWSVGIGIGAIPKETGHGAWDLDLRTQYQSNSDDRHVFVGNLGLEYRRRFDTSPGGGDGQYVPYYGASADAVFLDVSSPEDNVQSNINVVPGGSVFIGSNIGQQEFVQLGYDAVSEYKSFNFSGAELVAGVRFY